MNLVAIFNIISSIIVILGSDLAPGLSKYFRGFIVYGRLAESNRFSVPKSYFKHFYRVAVPVTILSLIVAIFIYFFGCEAPKWIINFIDLLCGKNRKATVSATNAFIALTLFTIHCCQRFYDSHYVSVFSKNAYMSIFQYIPACSFYLIATVALLSSLPGFTGKSGENKSVDVLNVNFFEILAILVFFWSTYHQHVTTDILGKLRKTETGKTTNDYKIPEGDLFQYFSSPHIVTEITLYLALSVFLWRNFTWMTILAIVMANQVNSCVENHKWYKKTFPNFPNNRKILIPYLY